MSISEWMQANPLWMWLTCAAVIFCTLRLIGWASSRFEDWRVDRERDARLRAQQRAAGERVHIPAVEIEFVEGGNTIWVHGPGGGTLLRIKTMGQVRGKSCEAPMAHGDVLVSDDIHICVPAPAAGET